jgi:hypothetical protein
MRFLRLASGNGEQLAERIGFGWVVEHLRYICQHLAIRFRPIRDAGIQERDAMTITIVCSMAPLQGRSGINNSAYRHGRCFGIPVALPFAVVKRRAS